MTFKTNSVGDASEAMRSIPSAEMKVLTDSSFDESTNSEVMTPAATRVSYIEQWSRKLCHQFSQSNPEISSHVRYRIWKHTCDAESTKISDHEMTRIQDMLIRDGCRDAERMDLTVTVVRPKRRSLWSWANVLLRCYRYRPLSIEFVTFYKGFLSTGFQTSPETLKVQGVSPLPSHLFIAPVQYYNLYSTPFCSPDTLSKSVCGHLFLRSPVRHLLSLCLLPWGLISALISCTGCRWLFTVFRETLW